mmetsp:Transcript_13546/g.25523  ORF Transcript_13546/g.25523 Transcript_13546/m.25523 type:complete len:661 (-) Transcript_13546:3658-5640(-)
MTCPQYDEFAYPSYCLVGPAAFGLSGILLYVYVTDKHLSTPPGPLIIPQLFYQTLFDLHYMSGWPFFRDFFSGDRYFSCQVVGTVCMFSIQILWYYIFALNLELILKLRHPGGKEFCLSPKIYHIACHLAAIGGLAFLWSGKNLGWSVIHTCSTIAGSNGEVIFGVVFGVSVVSFILCLGTLLVMWKNKTFVSYLNWHLLWIIMTFSTYSYISFAHVLSWFEIFDCRLIYMAMLIGASTGFLPGAVRLIDSDMRERVVNTLVLIISKKKIARKLNPSCGHRNSSASVTASFLEVEEDMPLAMMSKRNYAGLFRSLAAKFIIDSLISLSILHKLKSNQFEITGVKIVKSPRYKTYDITAKTITCVYGTLTSNSLFEFYGSCYKLIEYEEENFATVAKSGRFDVMKIIDSLDPVNNIENINSISGTYGGRSGSFIYRTFDKFFIVKTVTPEEKRTFLNLLLPHYVKRIGEGNTQFVRVLGIYMLCINHYSINLMIMENVLIPQASLLMKFDLKGSKFQRQVLKQPNEALSISKITLKDVDFQNIYKSLKLSDEDAERLMFRLEGDVRMLESLGMMDYSLLVAVYYEHEETDYGSPYFYRKKSSEGLSYRIALIDITQAYDFTKRSENCLKRTLIRVPPDELSSVSPDQYASRFLTACRTILG